ncbi:MAG TPA: hypothetical protein VL490_08445 [Mucilaginibacter sp.]|jgi:hypothetical protein|nr:hypothetical protein [Mucilaginibacter sp.]
MQTSKITMIVRDVSYLILVVILLLPSNPLGIGNVARTLICVFAVAVRVWQHVSYYRQTGKIY